MKHSYIGLVALAAMVVAGCGGGSDNGSGAGGEFTVTAGTGVTQSRLAQLGEVYTVPSSGRRIPVDGGHIVFSGCPASATDGCTVMVSSSSSGIVVMSTVEGVRARFQATPPATSNNNNDDEIEDLNEEIEQKDAEIEDLKNQVSDAEEQGSLKVRVPKVLERIGEFDAADTFEVTVEHIKGSSLSIKVPGFKSTTPKSISGWKSFRYTFDEAGADNKQTIYLYTNIESPNTRPFWKVHGTSALDVSVTASTSDTDKGSATVEAGMRKGLDGAIRITGSPIPINTDGTRKTAQTGNYQEIEIAARFGNTLGRLICGGCGGTVGSTSTAPGTHYTSAKGFIGTGWTNVTFEADKITDPHERNEDEAYLYFGMWANHPKDEDQAYVENAFRWISGDPNGPAIATDGIPTTLEGEAEFSGGAVGEYAIGAVGNRKAKTGSFTAAAKLYVDFGDDQVAGGVVHGQITDFKDGSAPLEWGTLRLVGDNGFDTPGSKTPIGTPGDAGGLEIEGTKVTGVWNSVLYGVLNEATGVTAAADNALLSAQCQKNGCAADLAGVAGWFDAAGKIAVGATNDDVAIVGAFGAAYTGQ